MSDFSFTPLGSFTRAEIRNLCSVDPVFKRLSTSQQNDMINLAIHEVGNFLNENNKKYYRFDTIGDAGLVLAPTASSNDNSYDEFLEIALSYNGGDPTIEGNTTTAVGGMLVDSANSDADLSGSLAVYTITILNGTFDGRMQLEVPFPNDAEFEPINATSFKVHAAKNHDDFSIVLKKRKIS